MSIRIAVLAALFSLPLALASAQEAPRIVTATAEPAGATAKACLTFSKPFDPSVKHPGDFLGFDPAANPSAEATGTQLCMAGLASGTHYKVTVQPGLRFADGTVLSAALTADVDTKEREPMVAIAGNGWILPKQNATGLTIQTVNVPAVRVRVLRIAERRMVSAIGVEDSSNLRPDPGKQSFSLTEVWDLTRSDATVIWSGTMQTQAAARNVTAETAFPMTGIVDPKKPGAYIVLAENAATKPAKIANDDDGDSTDWREGQRTLAGHWVLSSDLGLTSLQGEDGLHATVRSFNSAMPMEGVRVRLLSKGRDLLGEGTTAKDGNVLFPAGLLRGKRAASAAILLASTAAGDMAAQDLGAAAFDLSDRGAEGRVVPGPIEAFVYTDRGIYRPGETIHSMALLRTHGTTAVDNAGLTLVLRRPDGVEASRVTLPPQPAAGFQQSMRLSASAAQGAWTIEAFTDPSLPPVGRATVSVQDFVPQQLKVVLTAPDGPVQPGRNLKASIDGRFLYGAPGAGLHAEGEIRLVRDDHPLADATEYSFGLADEAIADPVQQLELEDADDTGHVDIDVALKLPAGFASPVRAELEAGLTEPGGRAVKEKLVVPVRTQSLLIGIRPLFADSVDIKNAAAFAIRAFTAEGKPIATPGLAWKVVREEKRWDWWRENGKPWVWHYHTEDVTEGEGTLDVAADHPADFSRKLTWGDYRLIVTDRSSGAMSSVKFSVGWGGGEAATDVPDRLTVTTDKPMLGVGQTGQVNLRGPFAGLAQVVVESGGKVLESRQVTLPAEGTTIAITATDAWGPGVHVLATAYRPLSAPARPHEPVRAVGLAWIAADKAPHTLGVTINAPQRITPRQALKVPVHVTGAHGPAFVTLAAVDEGILQITHFATPDPIGTLMGRTQLGLDMRDDYGRLLEGRAEVGALREGGDGGEALGGAGLPVTTRKTVALFQGPVALDANGDATVTLDIPDFAGELRLMAVAYDHEAAGRSEQPLTIRDPVVADVTLPRFLAPGDVAEMTLSLNDTDGPPGTYHVALDVSGPLALRGASGVDMKLDRGERRETRLSLAGRGIGIGHIQATLTGPEGLRIEHGWDIAVRSAHPDLVLSQTASQAPGETYTPAASLGVPFLPGSLQMTIGYSALGGIDVPGLLQSLYTYPHGCTEQLSSSALPLLYFNDPALLGRKPGDPAVARRVQEAIDTIIDRQDAQGRFGLWRINDKQASVWLNVYALDFLLHAREAGFVVPERVTAAASGWIDRRLSPGADDEDDTGWYKQPAQPTRAYAAWVLARTSRVDPSRLRVLSQDLSWAAQNAGIRPASVNWRGNVGLAAPLSLAHLAGAQSLMGDAAGSNESFRMALANIAVTNVPDWWYGAYYYSPVRDTAGVLAVAAETGHSDIAAPLLERLNRQHPSPEALNTQEKASLLAAAHALAKQGGSRSLAVDGAEPKAVALPFAVSPAAEEIARGFGVRNADSQPVFRTVTLRGAPLKAPPAMAQGFKVKRETFTLDGDRLDDTKLKQTDRFVVVLSGGATDGFDRRAVLVDRLPAGLEIESAVTSADTYPFIGQLTKVRAFETRDDRYVAAFDIGADVHYRDVDDDAKNPLSDTEFRVAYVVRAVTPGHFVRPETVVEDMYHPEVMARTAAGQIDVAPR